MAYAATHFEARAKPRKPPIRGIPIANATQCRREPPGWSQSHAKIV